MLIDYFGIFGYNIDSRNFEIVMKDDEFKEKS
jgi:hypothetical protein